MNYVLAGHKNPVQAWQDFRSPKRRKSNKGTASRKNRAAHHDFTKLKTAIRSLINLLTKFIIVIAFFYGFYAGYQFLTTSPRFAVSEISFKGNSTLQQDELLKWTGAVTGENIFLLDLTAVSERLATHPWIQSAAVRKSFPQTLLVEMVERTPYARIELDRMFIMDNFGVLLAEAGSGHGDLPLISLVGAGVGKPGETVADLEDEVIQSLKTMHYFNRLPFFEANAIHSVEIENNAHITLFDKDRDMRIYLTGDTLAESFENFRVVLDLIEGTVGDIEYIDMTSRDKVAVKHKKQFAAKQAAKNVSKT